MTGKEFANLVAAYIVSNFSDRGIEVYREVSVGKSIIGKNRRIDALVICGRRALAIECKYQQTHGTTDEKIPYALQDVEAMLMPAVVAYAGDGWSSGVTHMLEGASLAAHCEPDPETLARTSRTRELDHLLANVFGWWDILTAGKTPFNLLSWRALHTPPPTNGER